ncbi:MAG: transposase [Oscillospiraceae bacterium]|nr:transposase [Oscillospiraceae bacterium]
MLNRNENRQMKMCLVTLEDLMPQEHFLRDLDRCVDFNFIYDKVETLYSNTGRPSVDPVMLIKMMLIGYLYGIESERRLEQEVCVNIAYRWFLGIELDEPVPDHSTISQLRRRKFSGTTIFQDIFDEIVRKCMEEGLVTGKLLLTDSTHIKANARKDLREIIEVPDTPTEYMQKLDREAFEMGLIKEPVVYPEKTKSVTQSITDPDSGLLNRPGKPNAFCYLDHQTTDAENGIITDVFVTPGNEHDSTPHSKRLEHQIDKFGFDTEGICADAGYDSGEVHNAMMKRNIKTFIPERKHSGTPNYEPNFAPEFFIHDEEQDVYICPAGKVLKYSCYNKKNRRKRYLAKCQDCRNCPFREKCLGKSKNARMIECSLHEKARAIQTANISTPEYRNAMRLRQIWCEGNFAHQREQHNLRRTFKRGIEKITEQCLLSACALNLKRLVKAM